MSNGPFGGGGHGGPVSRGPPMANQRGGPPGGPPTMNQRVMPGNVWYPAPANQSMHQQNQQQMQDPNYGMPTQAGGGPMRVQQQQMGVRPQIAPYPPQGGGGLPVQMRPGPGIGGMGPGPGQPQQQGFHQQQQFQGQPQQIVVQRPIQPAVPMSSGPMVPQQQQMGVHPQHQQQQMQPQNGPPTSQPPGAMPQGISMPITGGALMDKARLDDLVRQIDSTTLLEDNVKDALMEYADEFVEEVIDKVCRLVQHRGNKRLEVRDVELVLNMVYNMPSVPRAAVHVFGAPSTVTPKLDGHPPTDAHKQRMMLIKKQLKKV